MLTCPLCQSKYATTGEFQPRLLSGCGHTFCQKCLDSLKPKTGNQLECPQCSLVSAEPHVPNITIMNYVDAQDVKQERLVHQVPAPQRAICQDCQRNVATLICFQCLPAGFKFCDSCSAREHNRSFGPVREHHPKPIASVRFTTPVPNCSTHPGKACLFFSFEVNQFACEVCREERNFKKDKYIPIDDAVSQIRDEVPSLVQLTRDRVNDISRTRAELEELLGRVDSEKVCTRDSSQCCADMATIHMGVHSYVLGSSHANQPLLFCFSYFEEGGKKWVWLIMPVFHSVCLNFSRADEIAVI